MKKRWDKILSLFLVFALLISSVTIVQAKEGSDLKTMASSAYYTNVKDAAKALRKGMVNRDEIITVMYRIPYDKDWNENDVIDLSEKIASTALNPTGNPVEGDYLRYQYAGWNSDCPLEATQAGSDIKMEITYIYSYFTTAEQEAEMDKEVNKVIAGLGVSGKSDYQKIKAAYDYVCQNVKYDSEHDSSYELKRTGYAALINKTAGSQGYAVLLYRLLSELGIDSRIISGTTNNGSHTWNIAALDDVYYNLDATLDVSYAEIDLPYQYFLRGEKNFKDHTRKNNTDRDCDYTSVEFYEEYPMAQADYDPSHVHKWDKGTEKPKATCTEKGKKEYKCAGCGAKKYETIAAKGHTIVTDKAVKATYDREGLTEGSHCSVCKKVFAAQKKIPKLVRTSPKKGTKLSDSKSKGNYVVSKKGVSGKATVEYKVPVNKKVTSVKIPNTVTIKNVTYKVTSVAPNAFKNNKKLKKLTIGSNVTKIGAKAFYGCKNLKSITIKTTKLTSKKVGNKAFKGINSKATIKVPKKSLSAYKKMLKKKGIGSKVKVKK